MQKRGQVTVFIIVGILILAVAGSYFYLRNEVFEADTPVTEATTLDSVQLYVEGCLDKVANEGLKLIGQQGGYYKFQEIGVPFTHFSTAYPFLNTTSEEL